MAYGKRISNYKRPFVAKRKYAPKYKKSFKKPVYKRTGYRKKYSNKRKTIRR